MKECLAFVRILSLCLWPEQGNNSPIVRKDAQELMLQKKKILLVKFIDHCKTNRG